MPQEKWDTLLTGMPIGLVSVLSPVTSAIAPVNIVRTVYSLNGYQVCPLLHPPHVWPVLARAVSQGSAAMPAIMVFALKTTANALKLEH